MFNTLTEPLHIVGKRRKRVVATVYPRLVTHNAQRLAGKYRERIPVELRAIPFEDAREAALLALMGWSNLLALFRVMRS